MVYRLPETNAVIEFEDYDGLRVTVRVSPIPLGDYFAATETISERGEREVPEWFEAIIDAVAPYLVDWDLPEPATREGLAAQPFQLVLAIARQWIMGVATVPVPLGRQSSDGATSGATSPPPSSEPVSSMASPDDTV